MCHAILTLNTKDFYLYNDLAGIELGDMAKKCSDKNDILLYKVLYCCHSFYILLNNAIKGSLVVKILNQDTP